MKCANAVNRGDDLPMKWYYMVLRCFDTIVMILCDLHGAGPRIFFKRCMVLYGMGSLQNKFSVTSLTVQHTFEIHPA